MTDYALPTEGENTPARFFEAPDIHGDSCLWERLPNGATQRVISRYDLTEDYRNTLWPLLVEAVVSA